MVFTVFYVSSFLQSVFSLHWGIKYVKYVSYLVPLYSPYKFEIHLSHVQSYGINLFGTYQKVDQPAHSVKTVYSRTLHYRIDPLEKSVKSRKFFTKNLMILQLSVQKGKSCAVTNRTTFGLLMA